MIRQMTTRGMLLTVSLLLLVSLRGCTEIRSYRIRQGGETVRKVTYTLLGGTVRVRISGYHHTDRPDLGVYSVINYDIDNESESKLLFDAPRVGVHSTSFHFVRVWTDSLWIEPHRSATGRIFLMTKENGPIPSTEVLTVRTHPLFLGETALITDSLQFVPDK